MTRRDFILTISKAVAGVTLLPNTLFLLPTEERAQEKIEDWFFRNQDWLLDSLNYITVSSDYRGMQIFLDRLSYEAVEEETEKERLLLRHKFSILTSAVLSHETELRDEDRGFYIRTMKGFVEAKKRLPKKGELKFDFLYGKCMRESQSKLMGSELIHYQIVSECKLNLEGVK